MKEKLQALIDKLKDAQTAALELRTLASQGDDGSDNGNNLVMRCQQFVDHLRDRIKNATELQNSLKA